MNLTPEQLAELKALEEAATTGPWRIGALESYDGYSGKPYRNVWQGQDDEARIIARAILDQGNEQTDVDADASFIAAAREAIPALIADLEEAQLCLSTSKATIQLLTEQRDALQAKLAAAEKDAARRCNEREEIIAQIEVMRSHIWPYHDECCKTTAHNVMDNIIKAIRARGDA